MKINRITMAQYNCASKPKINNANNQTFTANPKIAKHLMNAGFLVAPIAICAWLAKLFKMQPESDESIYLCDGSYFGEASDLN